MSNIFTNGDYRLYQCVGMPSNVKIKVRKEWLDDGNTPNDRGLSVEFLLQNILDKFAKAHPDWQIYGRYSTHREPPVETFAVYKGDEKLGELSTSNMGRKFYVTSPAIRDGLERGSGRETKSYDKAWQLLQTIQPETLETKLINATAEMQSSMNRFYSRTTEEHDRNMRYMIQHLSEYINTNWETLCQIAITNGMPEGTGLKIKDKREALDTIKVMVADNYKNGVSVVLHGDVYVVSNPPQNVCKSVVYSNGDRLPDNIRRNIGLLKLTSDETFVRDVGYRYDSTKFFVLTGETNE
jgi:hypothetical protein